MRMNEFAHVQHCDIHAITKKEQGSGTTNTIESKTRLPTFGHETKTLANSYFWLGVSCEHVLLAAHI